MRGHSALGWSFSALLDYRLLQKEIAAHSSILAWRIPWTEESGGLLSVGSAKSWTPLSD